MSPSTVLAANVRIRSSRAMSQEAGFTLIEVMIVVVIAGILAMVAYPSFMDSVRKGRRSEAFTALSQIQQAQERWRGNHAAYAASVSNAATDDPPGLGLSGTTPTGYYTLALDGAGATGYTATASASSGTSQASDGACVRLRVRVANGNIFYGSAAASGDFNEGSGTGCWSR
jgi:type IV pilus assembly protein PilE